MSGRFFDRIVIPLLGMSIGVAVMAAVGLGNVGEQIFYCIGFCCAVFGLYRA